MKEESGRRNYEEESSGRQASERHLGGKGPQEVQRWSWRENVPKPLCFTVFELATCCFARVLEG